MRLSRCLSPLAVIVSLTVAITVGRAQPAKDKEEIIQINDQLSNLDPLDRITNSQHKIHILKLQAGKTYQITLMRKDDKQPLGPYLRIEDAAAKELMVHHHHLKIRVKFTAPKDETYRFIVSGGMGEYVLKVAPSVAMQVLKDHDPAKEIEVGKAGFELTSRLTDKDARDKVRQQMFAKVFLVKMVKDRTYSIDMATRQFDAYLRLEDAAGNRLAEDDDSGGNLDARIMFRAPATGTYRVITTSFAANTQGQYLLRVEED